MPSAHTGSGKSPHAFMREAFGVQTRLREQRRELIEAALAAEGEALGTGCVYPPSGIAAFFAACDRQQPATRPLPRPFGTLAYARAAFEGLVAMYDRLARDDPTLAANSSALILRSIETLATQPRLGRAAEAGLRELAISRARTGYVALYRTYEADAVLILAVRHRFEAGYPDPDAAS